MQRQYILLAMTAIVAFGGLAAVLFSARFGLYSDVMLAVFFSGSVGAVVNNYYRLAKISTSAEQLKPELDRSSVSIQIWVSLFLSGILGFVAYGLFLSGLVQGALFPKFANLESKYNGLSDLLMMVAPESNFDAAKALIWAFLAGFSERFVPNVLDSLVQRAESIAKEG